MLQQVIILIDHCLGRLNSVSSSRVSEDESMLYYILASMYLSLKVENRISLSFEHYWHQVVQLESYVALQAHLAPRIFQLPGLATRYPIFEQHLLEDGLKFKTNYVSGA